MSFYYTISNIYGIMQLWNWKTETFIKKAFRAEFFSWCTEKKYLISNRVEEFKEDIMLDHRTETFMAVCNVMNYREAAELLHITQPAVTQHIQFFGKGIWLPSFYLWKQKTDQDPCSADAGGLPAIGSAAWKFSQGKDKKTMVSGNCVSVQPRPLVTMWSQTGIHEFF